MTPVEMFNKIISFFQQLYHDVINSFQLDLINLIHEHDSLLIGIFFFLLTLSIAWGMFGGIGIFIGSLPAVVAGVFLGLLRDLGYSLLEVFFAYTTLMLLYALFGALIYGIEDPKAAR